MEPTVLLVYLTPTGRTGRRTVPGRMVHDVIRRLTQRGYTGFRAL